MPPSATPHSFLGLQVCHQHKSAQQVTRIPIHYFVRGNAELLTYQVRHNQWVWLDTPARS
jgi:hypothetical protein